MPVTLGRSADRLRTIAYSQTSSGKVFSGKEAFEQQHARIFAGVYKGSVLEQSIDHLRVVQPDVAIADTSPTLAVPAGILARQERFTRS